MSIEDAELTEVPNAVAGVELASARYADAETQQELVELYSGKSKRRTGKLLRKFGFRVLVLSAVVVALVWAGDRYFDEERRTRGNFGIQINAAGNPASLK